MKNVVIQKRGISGILCNVLILYMKWNECTHAEAVMHLGFKSVGDGFV